MVGQGFSYTHVVPFRPPSRPLAILGVAALAIAACSGGSSPAPSTTSAPTTTQAPTVDNGILELGIILPRGGAGAELGQGLNDGADLAVSEINAVGGTNGSVIRRIVREEGSTPAEAATAMQELLDLGVDAIIGPASSNSTLAVLEQAVDAGVVVCSPSASALALDDFPDDGLFFRTIASDSLQARAIAQGVDRTGTRSAAIALIDDAYGRPLGAAVASALKALGIEVSVTVPFTSKESSLASGAAAIATDSPAVVVVIGDATTGPAMITAIDLAVTELGDANSTPSYLVNDAMRRPAATVQPYSPDLAQRITGVSPLSNVDNTRFNDDLEQIDPTTTGLYAANAYDCVNIIALASIAAGSNAPARFSSSIVAVTVNGSSCDRFSACQAELESGLNIDYDGPSGLLSLNGQGDRDASVFELFGFDDSGRDVSLGRLQIASG